jgi:hypothetical protein
MMVCMDEGREDEMGRVVLRDGQKEIGFTGRLIGEASSFTAGKTRWAEIWIYVTEHGRYVVAGCGRSTLAGEDDRHWAVPCETAMLAVEKLYRTDRHDVRYLPFTSRTALESARRADEGLAGAFILEEVQ